MRTRSLRIPIHICLFWINGRFKKEDIQSGVAPCFVESLVMWALGNIVGDSSGCHDLAINYGTLVLLLARLYEHAKLPILSNAIWTIPKFCRRELQPPLEQAGDSLKSLAKGALQRNQRYKLQDLQQW